MSIATLLKRWLTEKLAAHAIPAHTRAHDGGATPLRWRTPWLHWQLLSWLALTLLAPPFWAIGTLLLIDPSSDAPFFWAAAMAIVPVANGIAIVAANQRHHRTPFTNRRAVAAHYFAVAILLSCTLFALLMWNAHAIDALVRPLAETSASARDAALDTWIATLIVGFGISSSAHASMLHAWLAFEA
ncbi:hypothetical protein LIG30_2648 [Burkholderia sp. lig30]|jgi:hypothetical protein|uniref:hypothetical protein n=1 Tax=Burkholderia sp. lig30 TaxID=1192124 RepID=UPI000460A6CA|nr:hypothetical protein [Burkholderia sp. lig30]KDB08124.1 hypothetical protein LIG30_2648 [Burkholderia sp. lig30]